MSFRPAQAIYGEPEAGQLRFADQDLPPAERLHVLPRAVHAHRSESVVDLPDGDIGFQVELDHVGDRLDGVARREDLDGQDGRAAVDPLLAWRRADQLVPDVGDVDADHGVLGPLETEARLAVGFRAVVQPVVEVLDRAAFDLAMEPVSDRQPTLLLLVKDPDDAPDQLPVDAVLRQGEELLGGHQPRRRFGDHMGMLPVRIGFSPAARSIRTSSPGTPPARRAPARGPGPTPSSRRRGTAASRAPGR